MGKIIKKADIYFIGEKETLRVCIDLIFDNFEDNFKLIQEKCFFYSVGMSMKLESIYFREEEIKEDAEN